MKRLLNHTRYAHLFEINNDLSISNESANASDNASERLQRYYTLRKAWQDAETQQIQGWVDTYIHGDTPDGHWARAVQTGTQLKSVRDYPEKIARLNEGQCLLICDETSIPTVANLLERWQNSIAPIVIVVTNDVADMPYLQDIEVSKTLAQINSFKHDNILHILNTPSTYLPDAKILKRQLKTKFGLSRQDMVMKVYWRAS